MEINHIYNIDCFEGMKQLSDKSIDLIVTDPPYLHTKGRGFNHETGVGYANGHSKFANSDLYSTDGYMMKEMSFFGEEQIDKLLSECARLCKIPNIYLCCNETQVPYYAMWAEEHNLMFSILVWEKPLSIINRNRFSQNIEFIIRIYDYGTALNKLPNNILYNRVRRYAQVRGAEKIHPTQKPVELFETYIMLSSNKDEIILDPFVGSGSSIIAAMKCERKYIGFELNKHYYEMASNRIKNESCQLRLL